MAIDRHDHDSAVDGAADTANEDRRRMPAPDHPVPEERRSRGELYADLRSRDSDPERQPRADGPDAPRTTGDGSWEWKGLRLEANKNRAANEEILVRRNAEGRGMDGSYSHGGITPIMRNIENHLKHGQLVPDTEKFALKSEDRFKEKLTKLILQEPDKPIAEHAREIHDGIRYTFLIGEKTYSDEFRSVCDQLTSTGFELLVVKNTWDHEEYKGLNTRWLDPAANTPFEVQFHTPESWAAKQQTHEAYEMISDLRTPPETKERFRAYQRDVSRQLEMPAGWQEIKDYRKEGW